MTNKSETAPLKPCPFCGGEPELLRSEPSTARHNEGAAHFAVGCFNLNCKVMPHPKCWEVNDEEAIAAWNNSTLTSQTPSQWTSVEDRLPEETGRYWCYLEQVTSTGKSHYQWLCAFHLDEKRWSGAIGRVTHWMSLPPPPTDIAK